MRLLVLHSPLSWPLTPHVLTRGQEGLVKQTTNAIQIPDAQGPAGQGVGGREGVDIPVRRWGPGRSPQGPTVTTFPQKPPEWEGVLKHTLS